MNHNPMHIVIFAGLTELINATSGLLAVILAALVIVLPFLKSRRAARQASRKHRNEQVVRILGKLLEIYRDEQKPQIHSNRGKAGSRKTVIPAQEELPWAETEASAKEKRSSQHRALAAKE